MIKYFFVVDQLFVENVKSFRVELDQLAEHVKATLYDLFGPCEINGEYVLNGVLHDSTIDEEQLIRIGRATSQVAFDRTNQPKS